MSAGTRRLTATAATSAALLAALVAAQPATASPAQHVPHSTTTDYGGYIASGSQLTSVSASWVQPVVTCTSTDVYVGYYVALSGGSTSVQLGTQADCSSGTPQYAAWYEMYPAAPAYFSNALHPGDRINASIAETADNTFTLTLADTTEGWTQTVKKAAGAADFDSAEVLAETPAVGTGAPTSGSVTFDDCLVDGQALGDSDPVRYDPPGGTTSALTGGGEDFTITWGTA